MHIIMYYTIIIIFYTNDYAQKLIKVLYNTFQYIIILNNKFILKFYK